MNALYWKKFRCRHTRSLASCTGHAASPHPGSGQGNREPAANPIAICSSRLPSSSSRNSTPDTLHGSGSCRAAVNNDVVSIPPNYPTSTTTPRPTHPHQTAKGQKILDVFETEQHHERSPYFFIRDTDIPTESLSNNGKGSPVAYTGMTWSGFRPSDDACTYHYLVPSNMFAAVVMGYLERIFGGEILNDADIAARAGELRRTITEGIEAHAKTTNRNGETIYAFETDGLGHVNIMDDSNVPSLMAAPYLGYCAPDDPTYLATRRTLLSDENPYYYEGEYLKGIGSPHTPPRYVWPIALSIEAMTSDNKDFKAHILDRLVATDAGTHLMHEGIDVNDPTKYTREWFSWSNMMFCELVMDYFDIRVKH